MRWTDELAEVTARLYVSGIGPSELAAKLGLTRNQVLGKMVRMGHVRRKASMPRKVATPKPPPAPRKPSYTPAYSGTAANPLEKALNSACANAAAKATPPPERAETPGLRTILTVGWNECRYPIGDPQHDSFTICGQKADGVYCDHHDRLAHTPEITRTRLDLRLGLPAQRRASR